MRLAFAVIAALATRLALAPGAAAQLPHPQPHDDEPPLRTNPMRVEIGGTVGATLGFPEFGLIASIPIASVAAIEVVGARMPAALMDAPRHLLGQVQVRMPFREHLRSRKSLVVGVTSISAVQRGDDSFLYAHSGSFVGPHVGVSLQWPVAPILDFRFDALGIVTFDHDAPLVARAMTAFVWHPRPGGRS
jgi:hypothetical protein